MDIIKRYKTSIVVSKIALPLVALFFFGMAGFLIWLLTISFSAFVLIIAISMVVLGIACILGRIFYIRMIEVKVLKIEEQLNEVKVKEKNRNEQHT